MSSFPAASDVGYPGRSDLPEDLPFAIGTDHIGRQCIFVPPRTCLARSNVASFTLLLKYNARSCCDRQYPKNVWQPLSHLCPKLAVYTNCCGTERESLENILQSLIELKAWFAETFAVASDLKFFFYTEDETVNKEMAARIYNTSCIIARYSGGKIGGFRMIVTTDDMDRHVAKESRPLSFQGTADINVNDWFTFMMKWDTLRIEINSCHKQIMQQIASLQDGSDDDNRQTVFERQLKSSRLEDIFALAERFCEWLCQPEDCSTFKALASCGTFGRTGELVKSQVTKLEEAKRHVADSCHWTVDMPSDGSSDAALHICGEAPSDVSSNSDADMPQELTEYCCEPVPDNRLEPVYSAPCDRESPLLTMDCSCIPRSSSDPFLDQPAVCMDEHGSHQLSNNGSDDGYMAPEDCYGDRQTNDSRRLDVAAWDDLTSDGSGHSPLSTHRSKQLQPAILVSGVGISTASEPFYQQVLGDSGVDIRGSREGDLEEVPGELIYESLESDDEDPDMPAAQGPLAAGGMLKRNKRKWSLESTLSKASECSGGTSEVYSGSPNNNQAGVLMQERLRSKYLEAEALEKKNYNDAAEWMRYAEYFEKAVDYQDADAPEMPQTLRSETAFLFKSTREIFDFQTKELCPRLDSVGHDPVRVGEIFCDIMPHLRASYMPIFLHWRRYQDLLKVHNQYFTRVHVYLEAKRSLEVYFDMAFQRIDNYSRVLKEMYKVLTAGMGLQKERGFFEKALDGINQLTRHRDILVNLNMPGQNMLSIVDIVRDDQFVVKKAGTLKLKPPSLTVLLCRGLGNSSVIIAIKHYPKNDEYKVKHKLRLEDVAECTSHGNKDIHLETMIKGDNLTFTAGSEVHRYTWLAAFENLRKRAARDHVSRSFAGHERPRIPRSGSYSPVSSQADVGVARTTLARSSTSILHRPLPLRPRNTEMT